MPVNRPYLSLPLSELRRIVDEATEARQLKKVSSELKFRARKAARELEKEVKARLDAISQGKENNGEGKLPGPAPTPGLGLGDHPPKPIKDTSEHAKTKPKFPPTGEQIAAVEAFMRGGSLKISAFAGAGKTSTLKLMANERRDRGLYLAFNSKIAKEAKLEFPGYVDCRTTHSLAARAVQAKYNYNRNKMFNTVRATQLAAILELKPTQLEKAVTLTDVQQAHLLLSTIRRFCQSDDQELSDHHSSMTSRLLGLKSETRAEVHRWVQHQARALWMRMCDAGDGIPLGHDGYLKLWSLDSPRLHYDYVLWTKLKTPIPSSLACSKRRKHRWSTSVISTSKSTSGAGPSTPWRPSPPMTQRSSPNPSALGRPSQLQRHSFCRSSARRVGLQVINEFPVRYLTPRRLTRSLRERTPRSSPRRLLQRKVGASRSLSAERRIWSDLSAMSLAFRMAYRVRIQIFLGFQTGMTWLPSPAPTKGKISAPS
jgi:Superfamily I DNA and RNA helicases